jgi:Outer membrane protein beta-barrel domain
MTTTRRYAARSALPILLIAPAVFALPMRLYAQSRWIFEQTGGLALTTRDLGDAKLGIGYGFEGTLGYRVAGPVAVYAGWSWFRFHSDQSFAGPNVNVDETGIVYGLELDRALGTRPMPALRVRGGLTYERVDLEPAGNGNDLRSDYDLGWGASALLAFPLGEHWRVGPQVYYRSFSPIFAVGSGSVSADLAHVSADVAFTRRF